jgi:phage-related protein
MNELPAGIRRDSGYSLYLVQTGDRPDIAKTYDGAIQELRSSDDQNKTYRCVYVASFEEAVYVLHVFNKKSASGIATQKADRDTIARRFAEAKIRHGQAKQEEEGWKP